MFDLGKTTANENQAFVSWQNTPRFVQYILQRIPGNSLPSAILNIAKTPVGMVKFRARLAPIAIFFSFFLRFISRAQYRTCTHAIVTGQALRKRKRALPCRIFFKWPMSLWNEGTQRERIFYFIFLFAKHNDHITYNTCTYIAKNTIFYLQYNTYITLSQERFE